MNAFDALLEWASERGSGSWSQWTDACLYLEIKTGEWVDPTLAAQRLSALGHLEFDWVHDRFAVAPSTAVLIPRSSGSVVITGARPRGLRDKLAAIWGETDINMWLRDPIPQSTGPETWLVEAEMDDVAVFCEAAQLEFEVDSGRRLAEDFCPTATLEDAAAEWPPGPDDRYPRVWFDPDRIDFRSDAGQRGDEGLWHVNERRRDEAYILLSQRWYHVPVREYGPYLAYPAAVFLRYDRKAQQLLVPNRTPLPPLLARAATLQSGRLAIRKETHHAYVNIDENLASLIGMRLGTRIGVAKN